MCRRRLTSTHCHPWLLSRHLSLIMLPTQLNPRYRTQTARSFITALVAEFQSWKQSWADSSSEDFLVLELLYQRLLDWYTFPFLISTDHTRSLRFRLVFWLETKARLSTSHPVSETFFLGLSRNIPRMKGNDVRSSLPRRPQVSLLPLQLQSEVSYSPWRKSRIISRWRHSGVVSHVRWLRRSRWNWSIRLETARVSCFRSRMGMIMIGMRLKSFLLFCLVSLGYSHLYYYLVN